MKRTASFAIALLVGLSLAAPSAAMLDGQGRGQGGGQGGKADKPAKKQHPGDHAGGANKANKAKPDKAQPAKKANKDVKKSDRDADVVVVDRDGHARVIREYRGTGSLPPGLAKRQSLPPGLRRQLVERGELPPGLRTYTVDVPGPWAARLPPIPDHYHRYFVGDDLIVVDTRTDRIVAVVRDVLR